MAVMAILRCHCRLHKKDGYGMNYTYLLKCADATFYCGWTNDLKKRLTAHNSGCGAKYTKPRRPVALAYYEEFGPGGKHTWTGLPPGKDGESPKREKSKRTDSRRREK